jgi:hypothetical protein
MHKKFQRLSTIGKNSVNPHNADPTGSKSLKVVVVPTDLISNGVRAEVILINPLPSKNTYDFLLSVDVWFHRYSIFPSSLRIPNSWQVWTQMHQEADISTCHTSSGATFSCGVISMGFDFRNYSTAHPEPRTHSVEPTVFFAVINKTGVNQSPGNPL